MKLNKMFHQNVILILLFYTFHINSQIPEDVSASRACALIKSTIYCFGGHTSSDIDGVLTVNNNAYYLNLEQYNDFTTFDRRNITWQTGPINLANDSTILEQRTFAASVPIYYDNSYLVYGGASDSGSAESLSLKFPFINFQTSNNQWRSLSLPATNNYTNRGSMVNLGNDTIFIWGGLVQSTSNVSQNFVHFYDYKSAAWGPSIYSNLPMRSEHTATLGGDNMIYVLGGNMFSSQYPYHNYCDFNYILKFDTTSLTWSEITANGDVPNSRSFHSTTYLPNTNFLLIYGGNKRIPTYDDLSDSLCYIYDYEKNVFKTVNIPPRSDNQSITRFGHFATVYANKYLVFAFGYASINDPGDTLNVLNIADTSNVNWIISTPKKDLDPSTIAAIAVPISMVVLGSIVGYLAYRRHKARKLKSRNQLVLEDPRNNLETQQYLNAVKNPSVTNEAIKPSAYPVIKPTEDIATHKNDSLVDTSVTDTENLTNTMTENKSVSRDPTDGTMAVLTTSIIQNSSNGTATRTVSTHPTIL